MAKKRSKHKKPRKVSIPAPERATPAVAWGIFAWGLVMHLIYLQDGSVLSFFFGDALYYLQKARHLAEGTSLDADLPFHPPLVAWLLTPLAWPASSQTAVYTAAKVLMAAFNAATYAGLYVLLRPRLPWATQACLLMPLSFGEMLLSATPNSEAVYRALLVALLLLGWRWPAAGGVLHGLAALTRAEHAVERGGKAPLSLIRPARQASPAGTGVPAHSRWIKARPISERFQSGRPGSWRSTRLPSPSTQACRRERDPLLPDAPLHSLREILSY